MTSSSHEAKKIACTQCGGPLELRNPRAKVCVCHHCGAQLDLTSDDYAFLGVLQLKALKAPLRVGQLANWKGLQWRIVGHMRFAEKDWWWDEFQLVSSKGETVWIQYDDGSFSTYVPERLKEPLDPSSVTNKITIGGKELYVADRGVARISDLRGELTWKATVGDEMRWIDAGTYGIEWTDREIEVFQKHFLATYQVAHMFEMSHADLKRRCYDFKHLEDDEDDEDDEGEELDAWGIIKVALLILASLFFVALDECDDDDGSYYRGGGSSSGYSYGK